MSGTKNKMVTGFNHNIKHQGRVFHVQTEDSGVDTPHIITHLFLGGNILSSQKTSYAERVSEPNLPKLVRQMMEDQHKAMLRALIAGEHDENIAQYAQRAWQPGKVESEQGEVDVGHAARESVLPGEAPVPLEAPKPVARSASPSLFADPAADTIFGEDLISERSLDEVILSYLAEDPGEP